MLALRGQQREIRRWIAVDHDQVGVRAGCDGASLPSWRNSLAAMCVAVATTPMGRVGTSDECVETLLSLCRPSAVA
jgi:hypothetical protein